MPLTSRPRGGSGAQVDKQWEQFQDALHPKRFKRRIETRAIAVLFAAARIYVASIEEEFAPNRAAKNARLTIFIKGHETPLLGVARKRESKQRFASQRVAPNAKGIARHISSRRLTNTSIFVGIMKSSRDYKAMYGLHEGAKIRITAKMRGMFYMLWLVSVGKLEASALTGRARALWQARPARGNKKNSSWRPLDEQKKFIRIPPRPFFDDAFSNQKNHKKVHKMLFQFVNETLRETIKGK